MLRKSIAQVLKLEIEAFAERLQHSHPLMSAARDGKVGPDAVVAYLAGIRWLLQHTCAHLGVARASASSSGQLALAEYFGSKLAQEAGHERWADSDIAEMVKVYGVEAPDPPAAMKAMVRHIGSMAGAAPTHYLAYVLFAELFTVLAGGAWVGALVDKCGFPPSAFTAISNHVELDQHHVEEGLREMDDLMGDETDPNEVLQALRGAMQLFEQFLDSVHTIQVAEKTNGAAPMAV